MALPTEDRSTRFRGRHGTNDARKEGQEIDRSDRDMRQGPHTRQTRLPEAGRRRMEVPVV